MEKNKLALASLAMDLKRVSLGLQRGSLTTASRFMSEARKRKAETDISLLKPYMRSIIIKLENVLESSSDRKAEDLLMYSQLIQNYVVKEK